MQPYHSSPVLSIFDGKLSKALRDTGRRGFSFPIDNVGFESLCLNATDFKSPEMVVQTENGNEDQEEDPVDEGCRKGPVVPGCLHPMANGHTHDAERVSIHSPMILIKTLFLRRPSNSP
jgi:hypothetical protein